MEMEDNPLQHSNIHLYYAIVSNTCVYIYYGFNVYIISN